MKKRYILLIIISLTLIYLLWCNISSIHTQNQTSEIPLITNVKYPADSFSVGNTSVFWQGFYHEWKINHRVNRLGDWIPEIIGDDGHIRSRFNHSAASGSVSDELEYVTFFTYLKTEKARFFSSVVTAEIRGREATTTSKSVTVKGKWPSELQSYRNGVVVLNGFDLFCRTADDGFIKGTGVSDKLSQLFIEAGKLKINGDEFEFDIALRLGADCDSPECLNFTPGDNEWFDYQISVAYQIIAYNEDVHTTNSTLEQYYSWRKPFKSKPDIDPNEIYRNDEVLLDKTVQGIPGYNIGIPLIQKIDINLPKGKGGLLRRRMETPHLLSLDIALTNYTYQATSGICTYDADLFFKNWKTNMHPLAYGNDGKAYINLGIKLLQINDPRAVVESQSIKGNVKWETSHLDQHPANHPNSIKIFPFTR